MAPDDLELVLQIHRTTHRLGLAIERIGADHGIGQAEGHVLLVLGTKREGAMVRDVLAAFAHRPSTLTGVVDRLVDKGLVERNVNPADRRSFVLSLTRAGIKAAEALAAGLADAIGGPAPALAPRRAAEVRRALATLEDHLFNSEADNSES